MTTKILLLVIACGLVFAGCSDNNLAGEAKGGVPGGDKTQCSDGVDNDGDGSCDFDTKRCKDGSAPGDSDCSSRDDDDEAPEQPTEFCGDGTCQDAESCNTCADDCGACPVGDWCDDTDGGFEPFVQGTVTGSKDGESFSHTDSCLSGTELDEWSCSGTIVFNNPVDCAWNLTTTCQDGRCV